MLLRTCRGVLFPSSSLLLVVLLLFLLLVLFAWVVAGGADPKAEEVHGLTAHAIASQYGSAEVVELLQRVGITA